MTTNTPEPGPTPKPLRQRDDPRFASLLYMPALVSSAVCKEAIDSESALARFQKQLSSSALAWGESQADVLEAITNKLQKGWNPCKG